MIEAYEALQGGKLHLADIFKAQMIGDERDDLRCVVVGEAQATADIFGHFGADLDGGGRIGFGHLGLTAE